MFLRPTLLHAISLCAILFVSCDDSSSSSSNGSPSDSQKILTTRLDPAVIGKWTMTQSTGSTTFFYVRQFQNDGTGRSDYSKNDSLISTDLFTWSIPSADTMAVAFNGRAPTTGRYSATATRLVMTEPSGVKSTWTKQAP